MTDPGSLDPRLQTPFARQVGIEVPLICGAMYPCSNPELVASVSAAGGIGVVQPISLSYVYGWDFREGLQFIKSLTDRPIGMNALVEKTSKVYEDRMRRWVDIALEEGVRFFVTALGNPDWVVRAVHATGGVVYHDVTERRWADKALDHGVDGLICVNRRAGGHAGTASPLDLLNSLADLEVPLICAGGIGDGVAFRDVLEMGYSGAQLGTRFIASSECRVHADYQQAILRADEDDVVLTDKLSGVPCAVINTPYIEKVGLRAGPIARRLLKGRKTKHWVRSFYALRSVWQLKRASLRGISYKDYFQAGKSVSGIHEVKPVHEIVAEFSQAVTQTAESVRTGGVVSSPERDTR
ncbi:MAG: nitronate monooxygenase [Thermoanaerobaculia bacterium]|nr:nitronate monooxygenase [Thermoanaerobaculia bacterium]